jgi:flavin-dependent dehydrogenase
MTRSTPFPPFPGRDDNGPLALRDGSRVAVVGGGPAGSFFSFFLLELAGRMDLRLEVDLFEPKEFERQGPPGCNMCGGIVSESLVQHLAAEGILLPPTVVQRGIESYVMHMDVGTVRIQTPLHEKRIASVYRGLGPRTDHGSARESFDAFLLKLGEQKGVRRVRRRVERILWQDGRPALEGEGGPAAYDLVAVACGVNGVAPELPAAAGLPYRAPRTTRTAIREFGVGEERIDTIMGSAMHVFLLDVPRIEFAALVPKGDYVSLCVLGDDLDRESLAALLESRELADTLPDGVATDGQACKCAPRMNVGPAREPFADRIVFIGDAGTARLYKDGIGSAYRTAKAAARAAVFDGISAASFRGSYLPVCRAIERDNALGRLVFVGTGLVRRHRLLRRVIHRVVEREQERGRGQRLSSILWDTFTGSAPYREILLRGFHPLLLADLGRELARAVLVRGAPPSSPARPSMAETGVKT